MNNLFWKEWPKSERFISSTLFSIFLIFMIYCVFVVARGDDNALQWNITSFSETIKVPLKKIQVGLFEFHLTADNYLINQYYQGSAHQISRTTGYIFLLVFSFCLIILLTIVTYLKRFWYLTVMTLACFIFVSFRFEQLEIFGWIDNKFLILVLGLILPLSYYLHAFKKGLGFVPRVLIFTFVFLIIAGLITQFAENQHPFYFLANYNYIAPVVMSILFIFIVSHEIIYLILYLVSGAVSNPGKGSTIHFITLSTVYLSNVGLLYFKNAFIIDWNLIYINAFFLLAMSALIGIGGIKQREVKYDHIIPFRPFGGYFFFSMGIICFATISFHTHTLNDPVLETFEDAIVFSHIGFGVMFLLYILVNFANLLNKNLRVYKVVYKENNMPYVSANLAGLVIVTALYFLSNQAALQQAIAGYYNGLGSVYYNEGNQFLSEEYYKKGALFGFNNHRSNYSIGEMAYYDNDLNKAITSFKKATIKNPTPFAYINLANAQKNKYLFFDGLFTLKEGLGKFPNSAQLKNNIGLIFKGTNLLDSAIYYMEQGADTDWGNKTNLTNIVGILARSSVELPTDSLRRIFEETSHIPLKTNLLALSNNTSGWLRESEQDLPTDSTFDLHQFTYFYNREFSTLGSSDSKRIEIIEILAQAQTNALFRRELVYLANLKKYMLHDLTSFFRGMDQLQHDPVNRGYYNHILGIVAMENEAPELAASFFQNAMEENYEGAEVNLAIALTEAGLKAQALGVWNKLWQTDSLQIANEMIVCLASPIEIIANSDADALKYQAIRYRITTLNKVDFETILQSIKNQHFQSGAYSHYIKHKIYSGMYDEAVFYMGELNHLDKKEAEKLKKLLARYQFGDGLIGVGQLKNEKIVSYWSKPHDQSSQSFFNDCGYKNPFNEANVLMAAHFYTRQLGNEDEAYSILLNAMELNPYAIRLKKGYILQAVKIGLINYAELELEKLKDLVSAKEYNEFKKKVDSEILEFESFSFPI